MDNARRTRGPKPVRGGQRPQEPGESGIIPGTIRMLKLFVYGTLKRGYRNHDTYCQGALEIREAQVCGRLYDGPGFPVLEVPDEDVLACGTADALADAATQRRLSERAGKDPGPTRKDGATPGWDTVYGEMFTFDDPETRLPAIDRLEGFRPAGSSLYRRVLVPAVVGSVRDLAWVYTLEAMGIKHRRIPSGLWPEQRRTTPE